MTAEWLRATVKDVDSSGSWTAIASSPVVDRDEERVVPGALFWRTKTIPVHADHAFSVERCIGRARPYYDRSGSLLVDGKFGTSELAQKVRRAVVDGVVDSMSIVMHGVERGRGKDGITEIRRAELVSCDWVSIPSNYAATVLAARGYGTVADARRMANAALVSLVEAGVVEARSVLAFDPRRAPIRTTADVRRLIRELRCFTERS